ncbi:MAG TPA: SDR family NAD(P)-dependent oxidoreductase [Acidimicrobiales bacterium]|nr:SDR family NAD(P)-dependent oxidoreductase [Acidimicrobiales bacterium]
MTLLDGRVVIVTGAGRGLGRAEALEVAREGARVVVNDMDAVEADAVVKEIEAAGGEAVVDIGDVADWDHARGLIEGTASRWGRLDGVVNNAGILRDRMIFNMAEDEWDAVIRVHLKGHFCMSRWACTYWRDQGKAAGGATYGRVVNTASEALFGSPGQPNYASAKAGIVGLTGSIARGMGKYGVTANAICPRALTRMTEQLGGFDDLGPEKVAPLVAYLLSPEAGHVNNRTFIVYGRMITLLSPMTEVERWDADADWTPALVATTLAGLQSGQ